MREEKATSNIHWLVVDVQSSTMYRAIRLTHHVDIFLLLLTALSRLNSADLSYRQSLSLRSPSSSAAQPPQETHRSLTLW